MEAQTRSLRVPGELEQVRVATDFVTEVAQQAGLGKDGIFHCQLSIEEIFTNIVEHGYQFNSSGKTIELICQATETHLLISILDEAPAFNPLELEDPDPDTPLWERESGGWGVYFVRQYMDDVRYQLASDGRNHLILEKSLPDKT